MSNIIELYEEFEDHLSSLLIGNINPIFKNRIE
jgi:hypothetical protein